MNRDLTTDDRRAQQREADMREYKQTQQDFNAEILADGDRTDFGKRRRHTRSKNDPALLASSGGLTTRLLTAMVFNDFADNVKKAVEALFHLVHHWPSVKEHIEQSPYITATDAMAPDLIVAFAPVAVSSKVADILRQQIEAVQDAQAIVDARHAEQKFLGPFLEERDVHRLKHIFHIRHDPDACGYAHSITQVAKLERELCEENAPKTEMAYIFGVIAAPVTARGYDNNVAEANAEISASNLANIEAAQQARPIPPPQFNIV